MNLQQQCVTMSHLYASFLRQFCLVHGVSSDSYTDEELIAVAQWWRKLPGADSLKQVRGFVRSIRNGAKVGTHPVDVTMPIGAPDPRWN